MSYWFGLRPDVAPVPVLYWGARAIMPEVDIPYDRHQFNDYNGNQDERRALWYWIQTTGIPRLREELNRQGVKANADVLVTVVDHDRTIIANPRKSHGYLYIGAWNETTRTPG